MTNEIVIFHGGCHGCTQQLKRPEGVDFCVRCQYFDADWSLESLNNETASKVARIREAVKLRSRNKQ